jgi:hypothetical protein
LFMKHSTRTYFIERVLSSYETFVSYYNGNEFGLRKDTFNAGNIAEALRDIPEHIFAELGSAIGYKKDSDYRRSISDNNRYYKIVCDLGNAIKHKKLTRYSPSFLNLDDVKESMAVVRYTDIIGDYYRTRKYLEVTLSDGSIFEVGGILNKSIICWSNELINLGLIPRMPELPELLPMFIKRKDRRCSDSVSFLCNRGEYVEMQFRAMIYRPDKNIITEQKAGGKFDKYIRVNTKVDSSPFEKSHLLA